MKDSQWMKRSGFAGAIVAGIVAGAVWAQTPAETAPPTAAAPASGLVPETPATAPAEQVIATINGVPINTQWFNQMLMSVGGTRVLQQAIDLMVVDQEARKQQKPMEGLEFEKLVQAEINRTLDQLEEQGVPHADRDKTFFMLLQRAGKTEAEFLVQMRIQAGLRMLSVGRVDAPAEKEISEAFDMLYGPRLEARVVTTRTRNDMTTIRTRLNNGEKFETVVTSTPNIVRVQPQLIAESTNFERDVDKQIKAAAFAAAAQTLSNPVIEPLASGGELFHAVFIDKIIPKDETAKLTDPAIRSRVEKIVKASKEQRWMAAMSANLHQNLRVEIKDPILYRQYQIIKELQQPTTQPAATQAAPETAPAAPAPQ